ncbi:MAG: class I SAM-dependent methyltransferase [Actinomyces sp.]|uniref:class I SAM-dependent methyltransferase n=1 Tax=Actinomyces sp. TaxID=29317 RepID=UPI0026DB4BE3|nr:class I SAM-dependent methyltransferase [Actinomyces sp.]MDO4243131.1 class I SAM-dependent methyltransferase [Actinomyces sp.]
MTSSHPAATATQARCLRADLEDAGWGVDAVAGLLGPVADGALRRELRAPALRVVRRSLEGSRHHGTAPDPVAVLTALFMLGEPVSAAELDAALPRTGAAGACEMGLVEPAPDRVVGRAPASPVEPAQGSAGRTRLLRAVVDLRPHEAVDADGHVRWWVASDVGELVSGRPLAPDHVLGIGGAGLTLAGLTPREPVGAALDLGTGCGIQALYLLRHAEHVTATDISARALAFTAFNAALAGTAPGRLELVQGSFLEPVAGRAFDLVVSNPPFVITPPAVRRAGVPLMEYRDAGGPVLPTLVPALAPHLKPGGTAVMLGNWEHRTGQDWRAQVSGWLPEGLDAWVVQREVQDPVEYAAMWLRDGGTAPERDPLGFEAALDAWVDDFERRGVEALGLGYLLLHRSRRVRAPWRELEEIDSSTAPGLGDHVAAVIAVREALATMDDEHVARLHPVVAPDVTEERHYRPGQDDPTVIIVRQGGGFRRALPAGTAMAALVGVSDGELSVAQVAQAVAALTGADSDALLEEMVGCVRGLLHAGVLTLR